MKTKGLTFVLLFCIFFLAACPTRSFEPEGNRVRIYYQAPTDESYPDAVALEYDWLTLPPEVTETLEQCRLVLRGLKNPVKEGYSSVLPQDMEPVCTLSAARLKVEVGTGYLELSPRGQSLVTAALSLSLLELEGIRYITITAGGVEQRLAGNYIHESSIIIDDDAVFGIPQED